VARIRRRDKITSSLSALRANAGDTSTCGRCNKQKPVNCVSPYLGRATSSILTRRCVRVRPARAVISLESLTTPVARQDRDTPMKNVPRGGSCRVTQSCARSSRRIDEIAAARTSARDNFKASREISSERAIETAERHASAIAGFSGWIGGPRGSAAMGSR